MTDGFDTGNPPRRSGGSQWVVLGLLVLALAVYWVVGGRAQQIEGWGDDLSTALAQAKESERCVLVFFSSPG